MKPFDLEAFKAGQKALTRDGRVTKFIAICDECCDTDKLVVKVDNLHHVSCYPLDGMCYNQRMQLVSMVSRHQALIDAYDPEDTWQVRSFDRSINDDFETVYGKPSFDEMFEYRLHPHNDLIKEWKKGAKIEACISSVFIEVDNPEWSETITYRIKQTTKTVYEWLLTRHDGSITLTNTICTEEMASEVFKDYANCKKTGRSWEVEA